MSMLSVFEFDALNTCGFVVEALKGGLVLAPTHEDGGAGMLAKTKEGYKIIGEIEGWEFVVNKIAAERYGKRLTEINEELRYSTHDFIPFKIPGNTMILDLMPDSNSLLQQAKYLLFGVGHLFIINRHSTKKHINELNRINSYGQKHLR